MEDSARGAALETTPRLVIEFVGGDFDEQGEVRRHARRELRSLIQGRFEVPNTFFHAAVVAGKVRRIVEGQDAKAGEEFIDGVMFEG